MAINIAQLQEAANRFDNYKDAIKRARKSPKKALKEKIEVAERHRQVFVPAAERLMKTQTFVGCPPPTETVPAGPPEPSPVASWPRVARNAAHRSNSARKPNRRSVKNSSSRTMIFRFDS